MIRLALLLGTLGLFACGGDAPPETGEAPAPEPAPAPAPAPEPAPAPVPEPEPDPGDLRGDAAKGAKLYAQYCATCHGAEGRGDGPTARTLNPRPADHSDPAFMGTLSDENVYKVIKEGGASVGKSPLMAPWGAILKEQDVRDLVAFVRQLSGT